MVAVYQHTLSQQYIEIDTRACSTVMAVSGGYPGDYKKGFPITGLTSEPDDVMLFHAATKQNGDAIVTNGGRVLAVSAFGKTIHEATQKALEKLSTIQFEGIVYRSDIGYEWRSPLQ